MSGFMNNIDKVPCDVQVICVRITPELAEKWLSNQFVTQRTLKEKNIRKITKDILHGAWNPSNGSTICFDTNFRLIDGQHRLWGIIRAKKAVDALIALNCRDDSYYDIDSGVSRKLPDLLTIEGYANATNMAALVRWIWKYEVKHMKCPAGAAPTNREAMAIVKSYKDKMYDAIAKGKLMRHYMSVGLAAFVWFAYSSSMKEEITNIFNFIRAADDGEMVYRQPLRSLRDSLLKFRQIKSASQRPGPLYILGITFKAINASLTHKDIKTLRMGPREGFPVPFTYFSE
jgi:hypothetical protein